MDSLTVTRSKSSLSSAGSFSDLLRKVSPDKPSPESRRDNYYWTDYQVSLLRDGLSSGRSLQDISSDVGRTVTSVRSKAKSLGLSLRRSLTQKQKDFILKNYPLFGLSYVSNKLKLSKGRIRTFISNNHPHLSHKKIPVLDKLPSSIPRNLLPYNIVKRAAVLQRDCPLSDSKVDDAVVIFYATKGVGSPVIAMHLDDLASVLEEHYGRRNGVLTGALLSGYKA